MRGSLCGVRLLLAGLALTALQGCIQSTRTPERLYPIPVEMEAIRSTQESLVRQYYDSVPTPRAAAIRNEIIAQRMYAVDVQYTEYETALTREVQEVGFAALTTAEGLTTASTLLANVATKSALSAAATAVLAARGHYNSEILLAQTIRTIQKQMRASRNIVATNIAAKINLSTAEYPLPAALSDVEDYYNAGTLTTGVIDTSTTVGLKEDLTKDVKQSVTQAPAANRAAILSTIRDAQVPVRSVVIEDVRAPLVRSGTGGARVSNAGGGRVSNLGGDAGTVTSLSPFEGSLTGSEIRTIQQALCVSPTGSFGPTNSPTRQAIASYFAARGKTVTQVVDARNYNYLSEATERVGIGSGGTCVNRGFANAAAVGASFPK